MTILKVSTDRAMTIVQSTIDGIVIPYSNTKLTKPQFYRLTEDIVRLLANVGFDKEEQINPVLQAQWFRVLKKFNITLNLDLKKEAEKEKLLQEESKDASEESSEEAKEEPERDDKPGV